LAPRQRHQSCCASASARHPCPASGHSACAPHGRFPSQAFHARMLGIRIDHANTLVAPFANAQKKTPPDVDPRAFAFLGDRGDRSPQESQSRGMKPSSRALPPRSAQQPASRYSRDGMGLAAMWKRRFIEGMRSVLSPTLARSRTLRAGYA